MLYELFSHAKFTHMKAKAFAITLLLALAYIFIDPPHTQVISDELLSVSVVHTCQKMLTHFQPW